MESKKVKDNRTQEKKSQKTQKNKWLFPVMIGIVLALILGIVLVVKGMNDRKAETEQEDTAWANAEQTDEGQETEKATDKNTITWNGKKYKYNEHLSNFLFLGVDSREKMETQTGQADAGQVDALYLLSWDRVTDKITVVSIPRDTMTDIEVYGKEGTVVAKTKDHINLSYAYGDGGRKSCELTRDAVSNLFYGVPIQGYCSLNIDGLPILTRSVGTVSVTVPNDSLQEKYPEFTAGAQVALTEETTETFVRYRDIEKSQSALARMERQHAFMTGYAAAAQEKFKQDPGFISQMYLDLESYMVTNISNDQFVKVMESAVRANDIANWTVPGEGREGAVYDEYHVDDGALYEKIIETFYVEAK